jgi:hypothetical protein
MPQNLFGPDLQRQEAERLRTQAAGLLATAEQNARQELGRAPDESSTVTVIREIATTRGRLDDLLRARADANAASVPYLPFDMNLLEENLKLRIDQLEVRRHEFVRAPQAQAQQQLMQQAIQDELQQLRAAIAQVVTLQAEVQRLQAALAQPTPAQLAMQQDLTRMQAALLATEQELQRLRAAPPPPPPLPPGGAAAVPAAPKFNPATNPYRPWSTTAAPKAMTLDAAKKELKGFLRVHKPGGANYEMLVLILGGPENLQTLIGGTTHVPAVHPAPAPAPARPATEAQNPAPNAHPAPAAVAHAAGGH